MMERKELIKKLRTTELVNGDPLKWVHLICEAAEMLERDEELSCEGCAYWPDCPGHEKCHGCARMYQDHYQKK